MPVSASFPLARLLSRLRELPGVSLNSPARLTLKAPGGTVNSLEEKLPGFTESAASTTVSVCAQCTNSCTCWASGVSLVAAHSTAPRKSKTRTHGTIRCGRRTGNGCSGSSPEGKTDARSEPFARAITGRPHFLQNSAAGDSVAPHWSHAGWTEIVASATLCSADSTFRPHFMQNCESSGRFVLHWLHNTAASLGRNFP